LFQAATVNGLVAERGAAFVQEIIVKDFARGARYRERQLAARPIIGAASNEQAAAKESGEGGKMASAPQG
jgi:hypothetical protein